MILTRIEKLEKRLEELEDIVKAIKTFKDANKNDESLITLKDVFVKTEE